MPRADAAPRRRLGATLTLLVALVAAVVPGADDAAAQAPDGSIAAEPLTVAASAYRPINPVRVLDTRLDPGVGRFWVESAISLDPITGTGVASAAGVAPDRITAVVVNATMIDAGSISDRTVGFGTVWPTGARRPTTSTNNTEFAGHTIPNLVIAPLGLERKISFYASTDADLALDVLGVFVESGPTRAGRFRPIEPTRALDTRRAGTAEFAAGETRTIDLRAAGVPASATGIVANVTAIRSRGRGFYRVWSAGDPAPGHSSVNVLEPGYQAGNQVISGVRDGRIQVYTNVGGGLTVDVTGYFTGDVGDPTSEGLFVPISPGRLLDTRVTSGSTALTGGRPLAAGRRLDLPVAGRLDVPASGATAVALNTTAIRADARGFVTAWAAGSTRPGTSSLNFTTGGQTVPNHAITSVGASGRVSLEASSATHLAVDATGWFLAAGATPPVGGDPVGKRLDVVEVRPAPLPGSPPTDGPYDLLKDRADYLARGARPRPTERLSWPPCAPLRYMLNVDLARSDAQVQVLVDAVAELEALSGIDLQYAGVTSAGLNLDRELLFPESVRAGLPFKYLPPDPNGRGDVDAVIGFSNGRETLELDGRGVIGLGGSLAGRTRSDGYSEAYRGFAMIDVDELQADGVDGPRTIANLTATTVHELGHLMGLGHITEDEPGLRPGFPDSVIRDQLMFPFLNTSAGVHLDRGDARGLYELYGRTACDGSIVSGRYEDGSPDAAAGDPAGDAAGGAAPDVEPPVDPADTDLVITIDTRD